MRIHKLGRRVTAIVSGLAMLLPPMSAMPVLAANDAEGYDEVLRFTGFEHAFQSGTVDNNIYADWTEAPITDITDGHNLENLRLRLKFTLKGPQTEGVKTATWNQSGYIKLRSVDVKNKEGDPDLPVNGGPYKDNDEHNFGWNITSKSNNAIRLHAGENELLIPLVHVDGDGYSVNHRGMIDWTQLNRILMVVEGKDMQKGVADHTMTVTYAAVVDVHEPVSVHSSLKLPTLFGNNMMFQQGKEMKVWGWGNPGEQVSVTLARQGESTPLQTKTATVDADGNWSTALAAMAASYQEYTMTVTARSGNTETGKKIINRILIGEVWVAGGQSNMGHTLGDDLYADKFLDEANNDTIRVFVEPGAPGEGQPQPKETQTDIPGAYWATGADEDDMAGISAVGYHFSLALQEKLDVPVGFLYTPVGGTVIESWISREAIEQDEEYKQYLISKGKYCDDNNWPDRSNRMSGLYIQRIGALTGFNVAGTIWYQGESNSGEPEMYSHALNLLRDDWAHVFGFESGADMPFVFTLVQPWITDLDNPQFLGYFAESMYEGWKQAEDTDMALLALYDLPLYFVNRQGQSSDPIHPRMKQPVGQRFAMAAYNMLYSEEEVEYTAPVYQSHQPVDTDGDDINDAIDVTFDHVGDGLDVINAVYDGDGLGQNMGDGLGVLSETEDVHGFAIAGTGGVYVNAKAKIIGKDTVRVWSDSVKNPVNVTYNFVTYYTGGTLKNSVGIPAIPFRTERSDTAAYFNMQDWTYADANVWTCFTNGDKGNWADFLPSWISGAIDGPTADWSYDPDVKAEGRASVKMTYTPDKTGTASIGPVLGYLNEPSQFENFDTIAVSVKNGDAREKTLSLRIQSGGQVYTAAVVDGFEATTNWSAPVAASSDFTTYKFSLRHLTDENGKLVAEPDTILQNVGQLQFTFADNKAGIVYVDDVRLGFLYDAQVDKSALAVELEKKIDQTLYTEDSLAAYTVIRQNAQAVMNDPVATQSQVNRMADLLRTQRTSLLEINVVGTFSAFERETQSSGTSLYADWTIGDNTPIDLSHYDLNNLRLQLQFTLVMPESVPETAATFNSYGWIKLRSTDVAGKPGDPTPPDANGKPNSEHNYGWMLNTNAANPIKLHSGENNLLIPLTSTDGDGYTVTTRGLIDWSTVNKILMYVEGGDAMKGHEGEFRMVVSKARIVDISVTNAYKATLQTLMDRDVDTGDATEQAVAAYEAAKANAHAVVMDDTASLTAISNAQKTLQKAIYRLTSPLPGDVDGDSTVTVIDALMALQAAAQKIQLDEGQQAAADVDGSAKVTAVDALLILQAATGRITLV